MRDLLIWHITAVLLIPYVIAECQIDEFCTPCWMRPDNVLEMDCVNDKNASKFAVKYKRRRWLEISCENNPPLSTIQLKKNGMLPNARSVIFKNCPFPEEKTLSDVVNQIVMGDVTTLDFQSFKEPTTRLYRDTFAGFSLIRQLVLSNNYLTTVSFDLFHDLRDLKHLDISRNLFKEFAVGFLHLDGLQSIDLSYNRLKILESGLFNRLQHLKSLNLAFNQLISLAPTLFSNLKSLTELNLAHNHLQRLTPDIFAMLNTVKIVDLSKNYFTVQGIPQGLFKHNRDLTTVILTDNKRPLQSLPVAMFENLDNLKAVYLDGNGFVSIPRNLFAGATDLTNITLTRNNITKIPEDFVRDCEQLRILVLRNNRITDLPNDMLNFVLKLEILDISSNHLTEFNNKILDKLESLRVLNLTHNRIAKIRERSDCPSLDHEYDESSSYWMSRRNRNNDSMNVNIDRELRYCPRNIEQVYLDHNRLESVPNRWIPSDKLNILTLSHNQIKNITTKDFKFYAHSIKITYDKNNITTMSFADSYNFRTNSSRISLDLGSNPIECDCRIYDFLRFRDGEIDNPYLHRLNFVMYNTFCTEPQNLRSTKLLDLDRKALFCLVDSPRTVNAACPMTCRCLRQPEGQSYLIDCSYQNLTEAPKSLQTSMGYHIELILTGNQIENMPSMTQPGYQNVTKLLLSNNLITDIVLDSLSNNLETLSLDSNRLTRMNAEVLDFLKTSTRLTHLELHNNPWICDCDSVDFLQFIQARIVTSLALQKVTCEAMHYPIYKMTPENMCPTYVGSIIVVGSSVALLGILIGTVAAIYYRYQQEIKVWLYAKRWCLWFVTEDELDKDKKYDAFVSFSHMDENFVIKTLVAKLEEGSPKFRLCVHYRDWIPGESIPEQIICSVENSRRTIVVLSSNFLESVWSRIEFRAAHEQALSEGRARVIIILYGDIDPTDNFDSEIKAYLTTNTYVKWGDPWFWEKLKYALPHSGNWQKRKKSKLDAVDLLNHRKVHINNKAVGNSDCNLHTFP